MQKTVYQKPELRDANDNIIQEGAFGKNTALSNSTNDGWIDYVMNDLEALHDVVGETSPTLDANGHVVEPANLAIGDEDGNRIKESYLKLSGGKVTGIASFRTDLRMLDNQDNRWGGLYVPGTTASEQYLSLYGGTRAVGDARLNLYSVGNGKFELTGYSADGANAYTLTHNNNGALLWCGGELASKASPAFSGTPTAPTPASSDNSTKLATTEFVKTEAGNYLPLTGGTMTGVITSSSETVLRRPTTNAFSMLCGSTAYSTGAHLRLYGRDAATNSGAFLLYATDANDSQVLRGRPDGKLTWGVKNVAMAEDVLSLSGGTMTGAIIHSVGNIISNYSSSHYTRVLGGTSVSNGAWLLLNGVDASSGGGNFVLRAVSTGFKDFTGKPDGTLTWNGQPIQTSSDKRIKQDFSAVPADVLEAWGKVNWQQFKYIDDAERKGVNNCRWHTGLVAQDVKEIGEENNVDLLRYGILCHDVRRATAEQEAVDLWTVRYEEALAMEAAYQRRRADRLEERIARLEALLNVSEVAESTESD